MLKEGLLGKAIAPELFEVIQRAFIAGKNMHHNSAHIGTDPFGAHTFLAHNMRFMVFNQGLGYTGNMAGAGARHNHHIIGKAAVFGDIEHDNILGFIVFQRIEHRLKECFTARGSKGGNLG